MTDTEGMLRIVIAGSSLMGVGGTLLGAWLGWKLAWSRVEADALDRVRAAGDEAWEGFKRGQTVRMTGATPSEEMEKPPVAEVPALTIPSDLRHEFYSATDEDASSRCIHCGKHVVEVRDVEAEVCLARESPHGSITVRDDSIGPLSQDAKVDGQLMCTICGHWAHQIRFCHRQDCDIWGSAGGWAERSRSHWHCDRDGSEGEGHGSCTTVGCMPDFAEINEQRTREGSR